MNPESTSLLERQLLEPVVEEVISFLTFTERRRFLGCSSSLWRLKVPIESKTKCVLFTKEEKHALFLSQSNVSSGRLRGMFSTDLSAAVTTLNLDNCISDQFLQVAMIDLQLFPNLEKIRMRHCKVTDVGLQYLSQSLSATRNNLKTVDIAFTDTTYDGTFVLRDNIPSLQLIRRQPEWLDGQFHTPFNGEIHTYYADGSFSFDREFQSNGFVVELYQFGENYLGDKLQYNNFEPPAGWPPWARFCYRPGVSLLRLKNNTVLVGQMTSGIRPPNDLELMKSAQDIVPSCQSRYFDPLTHSVSPPDPDLFTQTLVMVSKMRVEPLGQLMPPAELVDACRNTCMGRRTLDADNFLITEEERLHDILS